MVLPLASSTSNSNGNGMSLSTRAAGGGGGGGYRSQTSSFFLLLLSLVLMLFFLRNTTLDQLNNAKNNISRATTTISRDSFLSFNRHSFRTSAKPCPKKNLTVDIAKESFHSQNEEDKHLLSYFNGYCGGTYLEMGGLDGVHLSNSHVFNKEFGWKGVLVEANPDLYKRLTKNRPNEIATVHAAVCNQEQTVHFYRDGPTGAIWEFTTPTFRKQWWAKSNGSLDKTIAIQCSPLRTLLQEHVGETFFFDFFSLDIEGAEIQALESLDFDRFGFGFILVEANAHYLMKSMAVRTILEKEGYYFLETWQRSDWFINKEFASIYGDVIHHTAS